MFRREVSDAVRATCESILSARGVELVTFSLGRESVGQTLRLTVDRPEGTVSLDEIVEISEEISKALDAEDPIPGRYTLEVASAGIERPLVRLADYRRFQGRRVKVRCEQPIEGRRVFTGTLRSAGDESFVLEEEASGGVVEIPYVGVAKARLVADWDRELKGLGPTGQRTGSEDFRQGTRRGEI
jgi:ribosome maturation factor RimP